MELFQEVMDVDDHLLHTTEVVVAEAAEIIVLDLALIHPVSRNTFFNIHWVITVPIILIDVYLIVYFLFYQRFATLSVVFAIFKHQVPLMLILFMININFDISNYN